MKHIAFILMLIMGGVAIAQTTIEQQPEHSTVIMRKLSQWQDLKFGFMVHWGPYAQKGLVESWSICPEEWVNRPEPWSMDYVRRYTELGKTFNPKNFDAEQWVAMAKLAGMKYMVVTTKHHDGFCMFDTKETDYNIVKSGYGRDVVREIVEACRKDTLWTGLYFSKPDWHHSDYWAPEFPIQDRNVNYNPKENPDRWNSFCNFTYRQIRELTHNYGDIDILWLDGGWVRPEWSLNNEYRTWLGKNGWVQDIDMTKIATMARDENKDLLIVDRTVHGRYENYRTPEKELPNKILPYPWETCMTMGDSWSYVPNDNYKSATKLIHILIDIVSKGGNLLLNVGPDAEGRIPDEALMRMDAIGSWLSVNGRAIYNTRPCEVAVEKNWRFTRSKDGNYMYMIYLVPEGFDDESIEEILPIYDSEWSKLKVIAGGSLEEDSHDRPYLLKIPRGANRHAVVIECTREGFKK